jgi:ATP-binding cassette subfamily F protein 3
VLQGLTLTLRPGERLGLLGRNGAGKSTLIRLLAGNRRPAAAFRREGKGLKIGYFAQHQLEQLRPDESPLWHMVTSTRARASRTSQLSRRLQLPRRDGDVPTTSAPSPAARSRAWRWPC